MVLGLDEFLAEQLLPASKDQLHERGCTASARSPGWPCDHPGPASDFQVIGQHRHRDRPVGPRDRDHAATSAHGSAPGWLRRSSRPRDPRPAPRATGRPPSTSSRRTPSASTTGAAAGPAVHEQRPDDGGQPDPRRLGRRAPLGDPAMPRWDTDRRLARLLDNVVIVDGLPERPLRRGGDHRRRLASRTGRRRPGSLDAARGIAWQLPAEPRPTPSTAS